MYTYILTSYRAISLIILRLKTGDSLLNLWVYYRLGVTESVDLL